MLNNTLEQILVHVGESRKGIQNLEDGMAEMRTMAANMVTKDECRAARAEMLNPAAKKAHGTIKLLAGIASLLVLIASIVVGIVEAGRYLERIDQRINKITATTPKANQ